MNNEKALSVLKQVLDAAAKGGLFENMDASFLAAQCFNHISSQLIKDNKPENDANGVVS